ncbi:hypothetical protein SFRURICE_013576, partial [Spodoptera frugiperda]
MALGGSTYLKSATMLEQLLEEINFQRTKEMRQLMKDVIVVLPVIIDDTSIAKADAGTRKQDSATVGLLQGGRQVP